MDQEVFNNRKSDAGNHPVSLSIVMATFNGEQYLWKQLNSIISSSRKPDEIIIVDDFSTDRTMDILLNFKIENQNLNINILQNEKNIGYIKTFSRGIQHSSGDLIFISDQDDIWGNRKIEDMAKIMTNNQILVLNSGFLMIDENDNLILPKKKFDKSVHKIMVNSIACRNIAPGCTLVFKRSIKPYLSILSETTLPHDWCINTIGVLLDGLYLWNEATTLYRQHTNNVIGAKFILSQKLDYRRRMSYLNSYKKMTDLIMESIKEPALSKQINISELERINNFYEKRINNIQRHRIFRLLRMKSDTHHLYQNTIFALYDLFFAMRMDLFFFPAAKLFEKLNRDIKGK